MKRGYLSEGVFCGNANEVPGLKSKMSKEEACLGLERISLL